MALNVAYPSKVAGIIDKYSINIIYRKWLTNANQQESGYNELMTKLKVVLRQFLPLALVATILSGLIFFSSQKILRQSTNDPQIQMAQEFAQALQNGKSPQDITGPTQVDLNKSLSSFVIIFDDSGKIVASQAVLDGRVPTLPKGVFDYTRSKGTDRISWQPKPNIRIAAVLERFEGSKPGFILVGRSLKETDSRILDLGNKIAIGWIISIIGSLILSLILA